MNVLIQIISLQRILGGFYLDNKAAKIIVCDFEKMSQEMPDACVTGKSEKALIIYTKHLLHRLETDFERDTPSLKHLIERHGIWLQKKLKKGNL